jgi:hypothetical protein
MGWVVNVTPLPLYPREGDRVPIVQEVGWAPGPVWTGAENLVPTGIRFPDRPARSESLYLLRYPGPQSRGEPGDVQPITRNYAKFPRHLGKQTDLPFMWMSLHMPRVYGQKDGFFFPPTFQGRDGIWWYPVAVLSCQDPVLFCEVRLFVLVNGTIYAVIDATEINEFGAMLVLDVIMEHFWGCSFVQSVHTYTRTKS